MVNILEKKELLDFYHKKIKRYQDLRSKSNYPLRIDPIIQAYSEELIKLGDKTGTKRTEQKTL